MGRKLNSTDFLDFGIEFFKRNFKKLCVAMLFYFIPITFIADYLMDTGSILRVINGAAYDELWLPILIKFIAGYGIAGVYNLIFAPAFSISIICFTYRKIRFGEDLKPKEIAKIGFKKFGWVILMSLILSQAASILLYIVGILTGILSSLVPDWVCFIIIFLVSIILLCIAGYLYTRFYLATIFIALKNKNCFTALSASWKYTKKKVGLVSVTIIWRVLLVLFIPGVFSAVGQLISVSSITASGLISATLSTIGSIITPVGVVIDTILFISCEHDLGEDEKEDKYIDFFESKGISV